jgi:hypothetical protein
VTQGRGHATYREKVYALLDAGETDVRFIAQRVGCPLATAVEYRSTWRHRRSVKRGERQRCSACTIFEEYMNPIVPITGECLACFIRRKGYILYNLAETGKLLELVEITWALRGEMPQWAKEERKEMYGN